jgi:hypothetical protein
MTGREIIPRQIEEQEPFEHKHAVIYREPYERTCRPDSEWQRGKLEQLRYKWGGYRHGTRIMQSLGNFWREVLHVGRAR